jgi:protein SCO1/2
MGPRLKLVLVVLAAFAVGAGAALWLTRIGSGPGEGAGAGGITRVLGKATIGGPFALTDHNGRRVTEADFRGRHMLIYFGFTNCPDVCPGSLQVMAAALDKLPPARAARVVPMLITVDPERDTPAALKSYVESIHPRLVGLTGSPEEIAAVAKAYRVYYAKSKDERSSAPYTVDHLSMFFLMDGKGELVTYFRHGTQVDQMAAQLDKLL